VNTSNSKGNLLNLFVCGWCCAFTWTNWISGDEIGVLLCGTLAILNALWSSEP
jgi:hypothetical protein